MLEKASFLKHELKEKLRKLILVNMGIRAYDPKFRKTNLASPLTVQVQTIDRCNASCIMCPYSSLEKTGPPNIMEEDLYARILNELEGVRTLRSFTLMLQNEPLLDTRIAERVRDAQKTFTHNVLVNIVTNGALLTGEVAEVFAHHATWLRISIDGWDGPSYAEYRGVKNDEFTKVINNIRDFKRLGGKCHAGASIIVDRTNAEHVSELIAILRETGINSAKVSPCIVSNSGKENNEYHEPIFAIVKAQIAKAKANFEAEDFEIFDSFHTQLETFEKDYTWCPYLQILPVIAADLNVYACHDKAYNLEEGLLGSIKDARFRDFWLGGKDKFFRINPSVHCRHHCVVEPKNKLILDYFTADKAHLDFV